MANTDLASANLVDLFENLLDHYGPQNWWPAEHAFEVIVGAVLTQNTSWTNVELALENLRNQNALNYCAILKLETSDFEFLIRPAGFYRRKASAIRSICLFLENHRGIKAFSQQSHHICREVLLSVSGVGAETADAILLYALNKPAFVIDKFTRRIVSRLSSIEFDLSYHSYQQAFENQLPSDLTCYREYHALLVAHAKAFCRKKPVCDACPLQAQCEHFKFAKVEMISSGI